MSSTGLLPNRFLFRFSFPVRHARKLPLAGKKLLDLPADFALANFGALDDETPFGQLRLAWNDSGLGISLEVTGKTQPLCCDPRSPETSDGLRVFIDTRNTQSIHRASRYCQQFFLLPTNGSSQPLSPCAFQVPILRAREESPRANVGEIRMSTSILKSGYRLETWLPASALYGYEPGAQPRLGFYYALRDAELGEQFLSVGHDFPFAIDPSLWSTLELASPA